MPSIAYYFDVSIGQVQMTLTLFMCGAFISTLFNGYLAEKYGTRKIFLLGIFVAALSSLLACLSPNILVLQIARFFQGLGGAVTTTLGYSVIAAEQNEKSASRYIGVICTVLGVMPAFAPFIGAYLENLYSWRVSLGVTLGLFMSSLILTTLLYFPKPIRVAGAPKEWGVLRLYLSILANFNFLRYAVMFPMMYSCEWYYLTYLPFYIQDVKNVTTLEYGQFLTIVMLLYPLGSFFSTTIGSRVSANTVIICGLMSHLIGSLIILSSTPLSFHSLIPLYIGFSFLSFGTGLAFSPSTTKCLKSYSENPYSSSSLRGILIVLSGLVGSKLAFWTPPSTLVPLGIYCLFISLLGLILIYFKTRPRCI